MTIATMVAQTPSRDDHRMLEKLPNAVSLARLMSLPILVWLANTGAERAFVWLLVAAGFSDILDGWLARRFGWTTALGALLDSAADIGLVLVVIFGIWAFHPAVLTDHWPMVVAVICIWVLNHALALFRYGKLSSFHTPLIRFGMLLFGVFVLILFFHGFVGALFNLALAVCFIGGVEYMALIALKAEPGSNTTSGLYGLLRSRWR